MNSKGLAIGLDTALYSLHVSLGEYTTSALTKRFILATSKGISSTTVAVLVCANFSGCIWCSVGTVYGK